MLLHSIIELAAADAADELAVVFEDRRVTFDDLLMRIRAMRALVRPLVQPGDRVFLISENHLDVVVAMYAVPAERGVLAFGNTRSTARELMELVAATGPAVVIGSPEQLDKLADELPGPASGSRVLSIGGPHVAAQGDLTALLDDARRRPVAPVEHDTDDPAIRPDADPEDCAWLIHTSGTTGRPKGVVLTHRSLMAGVTNSAIARPFTDDDVYLFPFPLFHVAAYNVLHAHLRRRAVVLVRRFDPATVLSLVQREGVTVCSLAPTMVAMLLDHPGRTSEQLRSLRQISYGASSMPAALLRRTLSELPGCGLAQGYGMTELSGNAVFLSPDAHRRAATDSPHLLAAAGTPGPLVGLRIVDDSDHDVASGEVGEILVRGDQVCAGYWNDPDATAASRLGPWLRTGDLGRMDPDGLLYVVDRKKDLIITGGENVSSREVEDVLSDHPAVAQVAIVGIPDDRWGERVCAVIVPTDPDWSTPQEIIDWTQGRLAGFKRPRVVIAVDALPVNASGKVDKRLVRELVASGS